jgi:hypothetical protein
MRNEQNEAASVSGNETVNLPALIPSVCTDDIFLLVVTEIFSNRKIGR